MAIIKIKKRENPFVVVDRTCVQDKRLSWKARGLLFYLLSLPENWEINVYDLIKRAPDGRDSVYSILQELRFYGYVIHERYRDSSGKLVSAEYHVFDCPQAPVPDFPEAGNNKKMLLNPENPDVVKATLDQAHPDPENPETGNPDRGVPDAYIINNIQNKQIIKETAADQYKNKALAKNNTTIAAAALPILDSSDNKITTRLTEPQKKMVQYVATQLVALSSRFSLEILISGIEHTLIDTSKFTKCQDNFLKKLNAIEATIKRGKWLPPALETVAISENPELSQLRINCQEKYINLEHWKRMLDVCSEKHVAHFKSLAEEANKKYKAAQEALKQYLSNSQSLTI